MASQEAQHSHYTDPSSHKIGTEFDDSLGAATQATGQTIYHADPLRNVSVKGNHTARLNAKTGDWVKKHSGERPRDEEQGKTTKARARQARHPGIALVEDNWQCKIAYALLVTLMPRVRQHNGKPCGKDQQDAKRLDPKNWGKNYIKALVELSGLTVKDRDMAHKHLAQHVRKCQKQGAQGHQEYYAREALTSDIKAVISEIKQLKEDGQYDNPAAVGFKSAQHLNLVDVYPGESLETYWGPPALSNRAQAEKEARADRKESVEETRVRLFGEKLKVIKEEARGAKEKEDRGKLYKP
jgi:hypothetical protein